MNDDDLPEASKEGAAANHAGIMALADTMGVLHSLVVGQRQTLVNGGFSADAADAMGANLHAVLLQVMLKGMDT